MSPSKFVGLYLALPKAERDSVLASRELLDLYYNSDWRRASLRSADEGAVAYIIDSQDHVIRTVTLSDRHVRVAGEFGRVLKGGLVNQPPFAGRVYPAERFFAILFQLPEAERGQLFPDPGMLLGLPKPVTAVGLAPAGHEAFAVIGFETAGESGPVVTSYPISPAAFDRLTYLLAWTGSDTLLGGEGSVESGAGDRGGGK